MRTMLALLPLLAVGAIVYDTPGADFAEPLELSSEGDILKVELTIAPFVLSGPGYSQRTRAYNGELTAPTIRVKPGQTLKLDLTNALPGGMTAPPNFDHTDLHVHGLHSRIGEDPFKDVAPGNKQEYVFKIPEDHMGGTLWYHPHLHGQSFLQAAGGASGMFIVEDRKSTLPSVYAEAEELVLVLTQITKLYLTLVAGITGKMCAGMAKGMGVEDPSCTEYAWGGDNAATEMPAAVMLVNGETTPIINVKADTWYRARIVYAGDGASFIMPALAGCETALIAKDGIYLSDAPRAIEYGVMAVGNRADWMIRCPSGEYALASDPPAAPTSTRARKLQSIPVAPFTGKIATVVAKATEPPSTRVELPPLDLTPPCYLVDLTETAPSKTIPFMQAPNMKINGHSWVDEDTFEDTVTAGEVYELTLGGTNLHPFHMHVNPMQLVEEPISDFGGYFQKGDFHDVVWLGPDDQNVPVRAQADRFTGKLLVHCHQLLHQDLAAMQLLLKVQGNEGAEYMGAEEIEPGCHREHHFLWMTSYDEKAHATAKTMRVPWLFAASAVAVVAVGLFATKSVRLAKAMF